MTGRATIARIVLTEPPTESLIDPDVVTLLPPPELDVDVKLEDDVLVEFSMPSRVPTTHCERVFWSMKLPLDPKGVRVRL
jgi:hypothetical protein